MIRTTAVPRPVRAGVAAASVIGIIALAGCASGAADAESGGADTSPSSAPADSSGTTGAADATGEYVDGSYTAEGSYQTPESIETITVTLTLQDDVVTDVEVTGDPQKAESKQYQSQFIGGISDEVVGKKLDDVSVSRVAGSSLTSGGFTQALDQIKEEAAA